MFLAKVENDEPLPAFRMPKSYKCIYEIWGRDMRRVVAMDLERPERPAFTVRYQTGGWSLAPGQLINSQESRYVEELV